LAFTATLADADSNEVRQSALMSRNKHAGQLYKNPHLTPKKNTHTQNRNKTTLFFTQP
jgi:hypothetical protein